MLLGKPGKRMKKYCGCKASKRQMKKGMRYVVTHPDTKMVRFISEKDYNDLKGQDFCAYMPEPFSKKE